MSPVSPTTDFFLRIFFQNNEFIIQWVVLAIFLVLVFWSTSSYLRDKEFQAKERRELEMKTEGFQRVYPKSSHSFDELKSELDLKNSQIEGLKEELAEMTSSVSSSQEERLRDLEKRLAEYKIIERDLANLSAYKKQVQELRERLAEKE